jgi:hypothetical protein
MKEKRFETCISHLGSVPSYIIDPLVQRGDLHYCGGKLSKVGMLGSTTVEKDDYL